MEADVRDDLNLEDGVVQKLFFPINMPRTDLL